MLHITILSVCMFWIEYTDEITTTIPELFLLKIWDILEKNVYYPERTITDINLKAL